MTISKDQLNSIIYDYNASTNELNIPESLQNEFWEWFKENAEENYINNDIDFEPDRSLICGKCCGNSQTMSYLEDYSYHEGFLEHNNTFNHHAVNEKGNDLIDFTVLNNKRAFQQEKLGLANHFIGVKIPTTFIIDLNAQQIEEQYMNIDPLLLEYFIFCKNQNQN